MFLLHFFGLYTDKHLTNNNKREYIYIVMGKGSNCG